MEIEEEERVGGETMDDVIRTAKEVKIAKWLSFFAASRVFLIRCDVSFEDLLSPAVRQVNLFLFRKTGVLTIYI